MKIIATMLIGIALSLASCAQLQQSMQERKDKSLKRELELSHISVFTQRAGGGEKAVAEYHRINLLLLADREAAYEALPGDKEKLRCQGFASGYSSRANQFLVNNWKDEALVIAFFIRMPESYEQVNAFRGCEVETNALDFSRIYVPNVESLLRTHPEFRTARFREAFLNYLAQIEALVGKVQPDRGDALLRRIKLAQQDVQKFIGQ